VQVGLRHGLDLLPGFQAFSESHTVPGIFSALFLVEAMGVHDRLLWNFPSWSISAEFVAYLAFPVLFTALNRRSAVVSWLAFSVLLYLLNLLALGNGGRLALHYDYGAVRCLLEFSIGILVYQAYRSDRMRAWLATDAVFLVVFGLILVGMMTFVRDVLLIPAFAILVLAAARNDGAVSRVLASRPLTHLGEISYSVYMVNILLFQVVQVGWLIAAGEPFGRDFGMGQAWLAWLAAMALVITVSTWTHRAIEVPARAWLRRHRPGGRSRREPEGSLPLQTGVTAAP
jgi:peptidoglycan/LPS O-acetylase OafA/YrhL